MTNAQTWLDENIPLNQRDNIGELLIDNISQQERNERDNEL
ncbi:21408_t:CDS:1, partial [Racocetra persica]